MLVKPKIELKELYEIDDYLWLEETVKLLREKRFNELDLDNLIEELDDLANELKYTVENLLEQIIRHLLFLEYWESECKQDYNDWRAETLNFRFELGDRMTSNFHNYLAQELDKIYHDASKYVQIRTGVDTIPNKCPYTLAQLLDEDWYPKEK